METRPPAQSLRRISPHLLAVLGYAIVTILFTHPLILHPATTFIDSPFGGSNDQYLGMWDLWWLKKSLIDLHVSPFKTFFLYFPAGADLGLHELTIVNGFLSLPFQLFLPKPYGTVLGFNIAVLFSFVLAGFGAYALSHYLTRDRLSSFVCGLAFAFSPYRTMHIIHIALLSTGWFPLYLLFLLRTLKSPGALNASITALIVLLMLYSCMSYVYFAILLTVLVIGYHALADRSGFFRRPVLISLGLLALLGAAILIPQTLLAMKTGGALEQPAEWIDIFSANAAGYLFPTEKQLFYRPFLSMLPPYYLSGVPGHATFLGYTVIVLAALGIVRTKPKEWALWAIMALSFFVLSLGPSLHLLSRTYDIGLPYSFLHRHLPLFSIMRTPYRFGLLVTLPCTVLASYGLSSLVRAPQIREERFPTALPDASRWRAPMFAVVAACLLMLEFWRIPLVTRKVTVPKVYYEIANEVGSFGVVDLPLRSYRQIASYMLYQTVHEKPIATGLVSRKTKEQTHTDEFFALPEFTRPDTLGENIVNTLKSQGFRYIVFHSIVNERDSVSAIRIE